MTSEISALAEVVRAANRKGLFRSKPIFKLHRSLSPNEVSNLQLKIRCELPRDISNWLTALGYGDINEQISFREEWFAPIESGFLTGSARFAQDLLGNFYAFDSSGRIYYLARSEHVVALMADTFLEFVKELVRRDYKLEDWVNTLETRGYEW